jgi:hypothetical protein
MNNWNINFDPVSSHPMLKNENPNITRLIDAELEIGILENMNFIPLFNFSNVSNGTYQLCFSYSWSFERTCSSISRLWGLPLQIYNVSQTTWYRGFICKLVKRFRLSYFL